MIDGLILTDSDAHLDLAWDDNGIYLRKIHARNVGFFRVAFELSLLAR